MNRVKFALLAASVALAMAFTLSCSSDSDSGNPAENRTSFVSGQYELVIESSKPKNGDSYKLLDNNKEIDKGKVSISGDNYTFTPDSDGGAKEPYTAIYGAGSLTITSEIELKNGTIVPLGEMTPMSWGPNGTWQGGGVTLVVVGDFNGGEWNWDGDDAGTYTAVGNTFVATSYRNGQVASAYLVDYKTMSVSLNKNVGGGTYTLNRVSSH